MFGNHNQLHVSFQILFPGRAYQVREYGVVNIGALLYVFVLFFVYEYFTWTYICALTVCVLDAHWGQKTVSNSLELEMQVVVSHHTGSGDFSLVFQKNNQWA